MKILNTINEDYHMHSINWSDGMCTVDEIVQYVGWIWMKKIAITDHSQVEQDKDGFVRKTWRSHKNRWKNIYNDVEVVFGVEWDLLDEEWNCCLDIQWKESDFCILSCHNEVYEWDYKNITQAYINAIHKNHKKINLMWHICSKFTSKYLDLDVLAKVLNQYQIPIELNCYYLHKERTDCEKLNKLIHLVEAWVYVNSDMHVLNDLNFRLAGFNYLKKQWLIWS